MKRLFILFAMVLSAVSCGQKATPKALVLYYSQTGTTKIVAEAIQNALGQIAAILTSATDTQSEIAGQIGQMA